jgi:hypothetical protein
MTKITRRQENTLQEKPFIRPKVATPQGNARGCLLAGSKSEPNSLVIQQKKVMTWGITNHSTASSSTNHSPP